LWGGLHPDSAKGVPSELSGARWPGKKNTASFSERYFSKKDILMRWQEEHLKP
jgi:hypothetical protein